TWEDGAARRFVYKSQNYLNQRLVDSVEGSAERQSDKISVTLLQPINKTFELDPVTAFPTDHMRRIIGAALAGKPILELPLYDGSDKGEKIYQTLSVIGHAISPNDRPPADAA